MCKKDYSKHCLYTAVKAKMYNEHTDVFLLSCYLSYITQEHIGKIIVVVLSTAVVSKLTLNIDALLQL